MEHNIQPQQPSTKKGRYLSWQTRFLCASMKWPRNWGYLIAYAWHPASNAKDLVEYAERRRKIRKIVVTKIDRFRLNEYN